MYQVKRKPEDFYVEEVPKLEIEKKGDYVYFLLEKRNWNTNEAIKEIAKRLRIKEKYFNVAGIKDKNAVTRQYVSVFKANKNNLEDLKIKDIKISFVGYGKERIKLGQIKENKFKIVVRNLDKKYEKINFIENYFDDQRFGGRNHLLGEALVKKEFRKFCYMKRLRYKNEDYINAIRVLSKKLLRFYVNSFQSILFNKALERYFKRKYKKFKKVDYSCGEFVFSDGEIKNRKVPIVGFLTELRGDFKNIYNKILREENLDLKDFIIKQLPEMSSEGNERDLIVNVKGLKVKYEDDELNKSKLKAILEFSLDKGSYATLVVKKMFG